jgi:hypothetical protein
MEILRFEDSTSPAPKRKKSSKGYITLGFVAAVFGIGSAFATTTVQINSGLGVSLGQGVTLAAACDENIDITPITAMRVVGDETKVPTFFLTELEINDIEAQPRTPATDTEEAVNGCGGQFFDVQIFNTAPTPTAITCELLQPDALIGVIEVPSVEGDLPTISCVGSTISFQIKSRTDGDRLYKIVFDDAPSAISYITLVSRES